MLHVDRPYHNEFNAAANDYDLVLIDGRDRVLCLERVIEQYKRLTASNHPLLVLDNTERISGKYSNYLHLLDGFNLTHCECPFVFGGTVISSETTDGLCLPEGLAANGLAANSYRTRDGNATKGRWITTIAVPKERGYFTSQGVPL